MDKRQKAILNFWFGDPHSPDYGQPRSQWFEKDPAFDQQIRDQFETDYWQAMAGHLNHWVSSAAGCLALVLLQDQFPRNLFRNTPQAFASDAHALEVAETAIAQGFDRQLLPVQRWFIYLPFEHSEDLATQERSLQLWEELRDHPASASCIEYAQRHYEVIRQFDRFPHRNEILGRDSTPAELEFLLQPGSRF